MKTLSRTVKPSYFYMGVTSSMGYELPSMRSSVFSSVSPDKCQHSRKTANYVTTVSFHILPIHYSLITPLSDKLTDSLTAHKFR